MGSTTSYVGGTRNGPHDILLASSHMELWDEEMRADVHGVGIYTLPEMELPFGDMQALIDEIERVAYEIVGRDKFLVTLGGEHSITPPLVSAAARKYPGLSVLQIDAHADMRDAYMGTAHNHACAMRRSLEHARLTQVGIRSLSTEEAEILPRLDTRVFYDVEMRRNPRWIDDVVAFCSDWGFDPASIAVPVLLWHGASDVFSPASHARWLAAKIPNAAVVVQAGAAHFGALDVLPDILRWLCVGQPRDRELVKHKRSAVG